MSHTIEMNRTQVEQTGARIAMNWINSEWVDSGKRSDSFDPATGQRIGRYADAAAPMSKLRSGRRACFQID